MRTTNTTRGVRYSPDDGDYLGFLDLLRKWVQERAMPVRDSDVVRFAQKWAEIRSDPPITLRSPQQWLALLRKFCFDTH